MTLRCYVGLGSNLGDSRQMLRDAVAAFREWGTTTVSALYQSPPMGPQDQPDYVNAVAQCDIAIEPLSSDPMALLDALQAIEQRAGRVRLRHWGERTLDLDLLLYGDAQIQLPRLTVPHVGLLQRDFVVLPLLDLDANLSVSGQALRGLFNPHTATLTRIADPNWAD